MEAHVTDLTISLLNGLGLMALVAVLYGTIERRRWPRGGRSIVQGLAFGCGAVAAMSSPAILVPGILVDSRATFLAAAGAFVGPVAAVIALVVSAAYRLSIGGAGVLPGLVTMAIAFVVGLVWRYAWFERRPVTPVGLVVLALGISLQNTMILFLPIPMSGGFAALLAAAMTGSALFATLVLCSMMNRENRLIAREKSLLDEAFTDALTSLPNRRAVHGAQTSLMAASVEHGYVVLLVDVDHFKSINDRFGHDMGDTALCILSRILKDGSRESDIVARFGGEEFVVILPSTRPEEGMAVADRLLSLVREHRIVMPEADFAMTVSIGFVHAHVNIKLEEAIAQADQGLYRAKAEGRDRTCLAPPPAPAPPNARSRQGSMAASALPAARRP